MVSNFSLVVFFNLFSPTVLLCRVSTEGTLYSLHLLNFSVLCSCFLFIYNYMGIFICSASFQSWLWTKWFHKIESVKNLGPWEWCVFCKCVASCYSGVLWCVRSTRWISPLCLESGDGLFYMIFFLHYFTWIIWFQ